MDASDSRDLARRLLTETAVPRSNGEPVFDAPWQARVFALVGALAGSGIYTWDELQPLLGSDSHPADFARWLDFLEQRLADRALIATGELDQRQAALSALDQHDHPHHEHP